MWRRGGCASLVLVASALLVACEGTGAGVEARIEPAAPGCAWIAGRWTWSGCNEIECTIFQDGCDVRLECLGTPSSATTTTGTVAGNTLTYAGGHCTAVINGKQISGDCGQCSITASHR